MGELERQGGVLEEARHQVARVEGLRDAAEEGAEAGVERERALEAAGEEARGDVVRAEGARDAAVAELEGAGRELAALRGALDEARGEVARVEEARDSVAAELDGAHERVKEVEERERATEEGNAALSLSLANTSGDLEETRGQVARVELARDAAASRATRSPLETRTPHPS